MARPRPPPTTGDNGCGWHSLRPPTGGGRGTERGTRGKGFDSSGVWLVLIAVEAHEAPLFEDPPTPMNHPPSPPPRSHRRKRAARCRRHSGNNTFAVRDHHPFEGLLFPEGATARAAAERRTRYPRLIVARSLIIFISFAVTLSLIHEITTVATGFLFPATIPYLLQFSSRQLDKNRQQRVVTDIEAAQRSRRSWHKLLPRFGTSPASMPETTGGKLRALPIRSSHNLRSRLGAPPASMQPSRTRALLPLADRAAPPGQHAARVLGSNGQRALGSHASPCSPCSPARGDKRRVLRRASGRARCAHLRQHTPRRVGKAHSTC